MNSPACSLSCAPRFATPATPGRANLAQGIAKTAALLGFELMPWQTMVNSVATEHVDGVPVYRQVVLEVMRQQGKTVDLLAMMISAALRRPGTQIAYAAQTRLDARHRLLDVWWPIIARSKLSKLVRARRAPGSEALVFANGSLLGLVSGTETSGHGDVLDIGVIDEAWAQTDDRIEAAMRPAMMTRPAQLWIVSCAGKPSSTYFRGKVEDGRARAQMGLTDTGAYFGYSASPDADPGAEATWWACMPALGVTVRPETVREDFELMPLHEFMRAYLCLWVDAADDGWKLISKEAWDACRWDPARDGASDDD